jgi:Zn-dependent protease with chaperone function
MAVDFFQRQDEARHRTLLLLVFFALGVLTLTGLIYLLSTLVFGFLESGPDQPQRLWDPGLFAAVAGIVAAVVGGGSLLKMAQLAAGGKSVALMLNGQEIQGDTRDLHERRVLNVVEEMAIASGVPVPPVYLLPDEEGINAFAAGHGPGDAVVAVSHGCLTYLTRDELQGVVGHEFSHILNGDMRLNLRVIGLIFGIMALSQIGWVLLRTMPGRSRYSSGDDRRGGGSNWFLLGLGLYVVGMGGAFFGWLIQAAVSRQREFLADASAVQFTRNPDGIAGALKKIGGLQAGSRIANPRAGEVSHLFLADAFMGERWTDLLATHPPLGQRIRRLDPQFDGTYPEVRPVMAAREETRNTEHHRVPNIFRGLPQAPALAAAVAAEAAVEHVGQVRQQHVQYANAMHVDIPEELQEAAQSPFSARALIHCLLLDPRPEVRQRQLVGLQSQAEPRVFELTQRLAAPVAQLPDAARLPLVDLTLPALRQMSPRQHQAFRAQVNALINADHQVSLFEYALHCVLTRYLDAAFTGQQSSVRFSSSTQVAPQVAVVLSLLAWEGAIDASHAEAAFAVGMQAYDVHISPQSAFVPRDECRLPAFNAALRTLAQAAPALKRQVVAACAACIQADRQVTVREGELLRAVCATLDCPMPPLVAEDEVDSVS